MVVNEEINQQQIITVSFTLSIHPICDDVGSEIRHFTIFEFHFITMWIKDWIRVIASNWVAIDVSFPRNDPPLEILSPRGNAIDAFTYTSIKRYGVGSRSSRGSSGFPLTPSLSPYILDVWVSSMFMSSKSLTVAFGPSFSYIFLSKLRCKSSSLFRSYMGITRSPLPHHQGKLPLTLFGGKFSGNFAWFY